MEQATLLPALLRFNMMIDVVLRAIGQRAGRHSVLGGPLPGWLLVLMDRRIRRLRTRFVTLVTRIRNGTLRPLPPLGAAPRREKRAAEGAASTRRRDPLMPDGARVPAQRWGWLVALAGCGCPSTTGVLDDPEILAMIAAEPRRMGRVLRPLCRALGITELPDLLRLPSQRDWPTVDHEARAREAAEPPPALVAAPETPAATPRPSRRRRPLPPYIFVVTHLVPNQPPQLE